MVLFSLWAFSSSGLAREAPQADEISILADHLEFDKQGERIRGDGNIQVRYGELAFTSEEIEFSVPEKVLKARRNVRLSPGRGFQIQSGSLKFDLNSRLFSVYDSHVLVEPSYYFTAEEIGQVSREKIVVTRAVYTACDPNDPVWKISFSRGDVEIGHSAMLRNIFFRVKDTPVLYLPYFWFPINQEKAPGFLTPDFGRSSGLGVFVQNYFYLPLRDWTDLGFPIDYYETRGVGTGLEYRYSLTGSDFGRLRLYGIYDRHRGRQRGDASLQFQQVFASRVRAVADVHAMSDDDYYRDFRQEIKQRYSQFLESRAFVETAADPWEARILADQTTFLQEGSNIYFRTIPQVSFSTRLRSYAHLPLFVQWESSWANLRVVDSRQKSLMRAYRADFSPRIFSSFTGRLYTLTPSLFYRRTYYFQDDQEAVTTRSLYGGGLDLTGPKFYRSFSGRLDHNLYPQLNLVYETMDRHRSGHDEDQAIFGLDHIDRLGENRELSFSVINRVWEIEPATENRSSQAEWEWLSLIIRQKYGFRRSYPSPYREGRESQGGWQGSEAGFTDFEVEASSCPFHPKSSGTGSQFELKYGYNCDAGQMRLTDVRWLYGSSQEFASLGWRYNHLEKISDEEHGIVQDQSINLIQGSVQSGLPLRILPSRLMGKVTLYYDLENGSVVENQYSLTYQGSCWSLRLGYIQRFDGQRWNFTLGLESLGELGF